MFNGYARQLKSNDFNELVRVYNSQQHIMGTIKSEEFNNKILTWMSSAINSENSRTVFFGSFSPNNELISYSYLIKSEFFPSAIGGGIHVDKKYSNKPYNYDINGRALLIEKVTGYTHQEGIYETYFATPLSTFPIRMKLFNKMIKSKKYFKDVGFKDKWYIVPDEIIPKGGIAKYKAYQMMLQYMDNLNDDILIWKLILRPEFRHELKNPLLQTAYKDIRDML